MSIYWLCIIPFLLWFGMTIFQADRLNSLRFEIVCVLAAFLCLGAGLVLFRYRVFDVKRGFFVVVFAVPLIFASCFELFRLIYRRLRHENPCINVRTFRWIGDRPVDGFFTRYPAGKVISWGDVLFGISQMIVPLVIVLTLFIWSLAMDW